MEAIEQTGDVLDRAEKIERYLNDFEANVPSDRYLAVQSLRREVAAALDVCVISDREGIERAANALELYASLREEPAEAIAHDEAEIARLAALLGLPSSLERMLRKHLDYLTLGDSGGTTRPPHFVRALFAAFESGDATFRDRARGLYRWLCEKNVPYLDHFLWFHAWRRAPSTVEGVFVRNDPTETANLLNDVLESESETMVCDEDRRHFGRSRYVKGRYDGIGRDALVRRLRRRPVSHYYDLAGGLATFYLRDLFELGKVPTTCVDAIAPDVDCFDNVLPLVTVPPSGVRIMNEAEVTEYRDLVRTSDIERRVADISKASIRDLRNAHEGAALFSIGAAFLGAVRPEDMELDRAARKRKIFTPRVGGMRILENLFAGVREGDAIALFGHARTRWSRGVSWLGLDVREGPRLAIRAAGFVGKDSSLVRWEIARGPSEPQ